MKQLLRNALLTLALTAVARFPLRASDGRIPISTVPYTISAPGAYYLTQDLTLASGTAITISANNVALDLSGHTLAVTATLGGNFVINCFSGYNNLRITGGRVAGGSTGINLQGNSGALLQVDHLESTGAGATGVNIIGVGALPSTAVVDSVRVNGPAATAGISLFNVSGGRIANSVTEGCTDGITLNNARGVSVRDNAVAENVQVGIYLNGSTTRDNIVTGNSVQKSGAEGIYIVGSRGNRVSFNVVSNNQLNGIEINNANNNTVSDNILTENNFNGILLGASANSYIARNNVTGTQGGSSGISLSGASIYNTLDGNITTGNTGFGMSFGAGSTGNVYSNNRLLNNPSSNNFGAGNFSAGGNNSGGANF